MVLCIKSYFVIVRLGGCVAITLKCKFVILNPSPCVILSAAKDLSVWLRINSVKNLIRSVCYRTEILRLEPQNDIATQPLDRTIQNLLKRLDSPIKSGNDRLFLIPILYADSKYKIRDRMNIGGTNDK